jgi:hypothetical protein
MMTCRQVSTRLAQGDLTTAAWSQRLGVRMHLMMCDRCSTFKRWMDAIAGSGHALTRAAERDAPADLEARTLRRLERSP